MFYLGVPAVDNHKLTSQMLQSMEDTVVDPEGLTVVIVDNNSDEPYRSYLRFSFPVEIVRNKENRGYYRPLLDIARNATPGDLVGLCHNDLIFYEKGWDRRLRECFVKEGRLGMVGFLGSNEVDDRGGRGGGTMGNFRGEKGALMEHTGRRMTGLEPALILDSLFMAMRQPVVNCLKIDDNIQMNHFGDRIWPIRAIESEWWVGVLGVDIDHMSGQTLVGIQRIEEDSRKWCEAHGIPVPEGTQADTAVYQYAESLWLNEYRDLKHLIPARMSGWSIAPVAPAARVK